MTESDFIMDTCRYKECNGIAVTLGYCSECAEKVVRNGSHITPTSLHNEAHKVRAELAELRARIAKLEEKQEDTDA